MPDAIPSPRSTGSHRWDPLFVVLIAIAVHLHCLEVPFQMDDGFGIPRAAAHLGLGDWPPFNSPEEDALLASSEDPKNFTWDSGWYFRPTIWFVWHGLTQLGGGIARPWIFHSFQILVFAIGCGMLTSILGRQLSRGAALGGGLLAAVTHASSQAITWSSALGDTLALTFAIAAVIPLSNFLRTGALRSWISATVLTVLAQLSKDTALALLPLVALLAIGNAPESRRRVFGLIALATGVALAMMARVAYTNSFTMGYIGSLRPHSDWVRGGLDLALDVIAPWNRSPALEESAPIIAKLGGSMTWAALATAAAVLPILAACVWRRPKTTTRLVAGIVACAIALSPALLLPASDNHYNARALHGATAAFAVAMAFAFDAVFRSDRHWIVRTAIIVPLVLVVADASCHVARTEMAFAKRLELERDSLDQATRDTPPGCVTLAVNVEDTYFGFPMLGTFAGAFLNPPFTNSPRSVIVRRDMGSLGWTPGLATSARCLRIVQCVEGRFLPLGDDILVPQRLARLGAFDPETRSFRDSRPATVGGVVELTSPKRGTTTRLADGIKIEIRAHAASLHTKTFVVRLALPALENVAGVAIVYSIDASTTKVHVDGSVSMTIQPMTITPSSVETTQGAVGAEALARRLALVNAKDPAPALLAVDFHDANGVCLASSDWMAFRGILAN